MIPAADGTFRLDADVFDYTIIALYFGVVLGIGIMARRQISTSLDFFLSGRSLPAWVTGLAFISANLGAVEVMGMSANGAEFGIATVHYFWIGAVPAMLFLGIVMMPFYYGSGVRSVPEFMRKRFGTGAHLVNALSFAVAQLLIAGINLYLLATILNRLLGWQLWISLVVAAAIVLSYTALGGLSAAIYNEVLQFFVIVAALLPLTIIALHKVGGWDGIQAKVQPNQEQLSSWPATELTGIDNPVLSVIGIVFGLGFVLSFGYWTTNFVEVQRAMASNSVSAARRTPIIGAFPKMFVPFIVIVPGIIAAIIVPEMLRAQVGRRQRRREVQRRAPAPDARPAPQRHARGGDRRSAGSVHGRHGGQHLGVQHGVLVRPVAAVRRQGPRGRLLHAGRSSRHRRRDDHRDRHGSDRVQLLQPDGLPADAVRLLQRATVRDVHPRYVLETDDRHSRLGRPRVGHARRRRGRVPERGLVRLGQRRCPGHLRPGCELRCRRCRIRRRHHRQRPGVAAYKTQGRGGPQGTRLLAAPPRSRWSTPTRATSRGTSHRPSSPASRW